MPNGVESREFKPRGKEKEPLSVEVTKSINAHLEARKNEKISIIQRIPVSEDLKGRDELIAIINKQYDDPTIKLAELGLPSPEEIKLGND